MSRRLTFILLSVPLVLLAVVAMAWYSLMHTQAGGGWLYSQLRELLPGQLEARGPQGSLSSGLAFEAIQYRDGDTRIESDRIRLAVDLELFPLLLRVEGLEIDGLRYTGAEDDSASEAVVLPDSMALPLRVQIDRLAVTDIQVLDATGQSTLAIDEFEITASVHDELSIERASLSLAEGQAAFGGRLGLNQPYPLELDVSAELETEIEEGAGPSRLSLQALLAGELAAYALDANGWLTMPGRERHRFQLDSTGSMEAIRFERFELDGPSLQFHSGGEVDWVNRYLAISGLQLSVPGTGVTAEADTTFDFDSGNLEGEVGWNGFRWPLDAEAPDFESAQGRVTLSGTTGDWRMAGRAQLAGGGLPPEWLNFEASGGLDHADVTILESAVLGGVLAGTASWNGRDGGQLAVDLRAKTIDTAPLYPDVPAVLSTALTANGTLTPLDMLVDIQSLDADLADRQIQATGRLHIEDEMVGFEDLRVTSAGSGITLTGSTDQRQGVRFDARITDLGDFLPGGSGALQGQGTLTLDPAAPALRLNLTGSDLAWQDISIPELLVTDLAEGNSGTIAALQVQAMQPSVGGRTFDSATLVAELERSAQTFRLSLIAPEYQLESALEGKLQDSPAPLAESTWEGWLNRLDVSDGDGVLIDLESPAALSVSLGQLQLGSACFNGVSDGRLCADATWREGEDLAIQAELTRLAVDTLAQLAGAGMEFSQLITGQFEILLKDGKPFGEAGLRFSPGQVRLVDDVSPLFETGEGRLAFRLEDGALKSGELDIPITGQGEIDVDFELADVALGLDSGLQGRAKIDLSDLDILSVFLPMADELAGRFDSDLVFSGTVGHPLFSGYIELAEGRIRNVASGLVLSDIQLSGDVRGVEETRLTGSFRATDGVGQLNAVLDFSDILSPSAELNINGENLTLFDSDSLMLTATPDIQLAWQKGVLQVNGELSIPRALATPTVIPSSPVAESPDLEIIAGAPPDTREKQFEEQKLALRGKLKVVLGDEVKVDVPFVEAKVSGAAEFIWHDDPVPLASGNYRVAGKILAFGQLLEITQGNIGFPNVPASNPHLNIRAERQIYGNSEIRRAGVFVTGTMNRPVVEPYTDPMTNRERAQTLLVTGSDFNMERGVGAVNIGTYIAPKIFVSYGLGVFEDENVVSIRYDLGRNWGVKATSGERQTGIDMSYTLER